MTVPSGVTLRTIELLQSAMKTSPAVSTARPIGIIPAVTAGITLGDRPAALAHFQRGLEILEPIARRGDDSIAAINAAVDYGKIGDILIIDGKAADALGYYVQSERRSFGLAGVDPSRPQRASIGR